MKKILAIAVFAYLNLNAEEIRVAVAANVSYAIDDLKKAFYDKYPKIKVQTILGSSGKLAAQILHGADFDIFMSANMSYPDRLYKEKLALDKPVVYAKGALVMLSAKKRNFCADIFLLKDSDIKKIAIANPKTAPYGTAAKEALVNAKIYEEIKTKLVYAESVSQTLVFATKAADIGIVAKSSLFSPKMKSYKEAIHWSDIDKTLYTPIDQGIVMLMPAKDNTQAKAFYEFLLSAEAKQILKRYGYRIP